MDQWELEVWREERDRRLYAAHAQQEKAAVRALMTSRKRGR